MTVRVEVILRKVPSERAKVAVMVWVSLGRARVSEGSAVLPEMPDRAKGSYPNRSASPIEAADVQELDDLIVGGSGSSAQ